MDNKDLDSVVISGYLYIPSQGFLKLKQSWSKKYFVLYKRSSSGIQRLELFDSQESYLKKSNTLIKIIPLNECHKVSITSHKHQSNVFEIRTREAVHLLSTETYQQMQLWLEALRSVAFDNNINSLPSSNNSITIKSTSTPTKNGNHTKSSSKTIPEAITLTVNGPNKVNCNNQPLQEENMLYSSVDAPDVFTVKLVASEATLRCKLTATDYYLVLTSVSISLAEQLSDTRQGKILWTWPYRHIRRYGCTKEGFSLEAGRKCLTGEGLFSFITTEGSAIFKCVASHVSSLKTTSPNGIFPVPRPLLTDVLTSISSSVTNSTTSSTSTSNTSTTNNTNCSVLLSTANSINSTGTETPVTTTDPSCHNRQSSSPHLLSSNKALNTADEQIVVTTKCVTSEPVKSSSPSSSSPVPKTPNSPHSREFNSVSSYTKNDNNLGPMQTVSNSNNRPTATAIPTSQTAASNQSMQISSNMNNHQHHHTDHQHHHHHQYHHHSYHHRPSSPKPPSLPTVPRPNQRDSPIHHNNNNTTTVHSDSNNFASSNNNNNQSSSSPAFRQSCNNKLTTESNEANLEAINQKSNRFIKLSSSSLVETTRKDPSTINSTVTIKAAKQDYQTSLSSSHENGLIIINAVSDDEESMARAGQYPIIKPPRRGQFNCNGKQLTFRIDSGEDDADDCDSIKMITALPAITVVDPLYEDPIFVSREELFGLKAEEKEENHYEIPVIVNGNGNVNGNTNGETTPMNPDYDQVTITSNGDGLLTNSGNDYDNFNNKMNVSIAEGKITNDKLIHPRTHPQMSRLTSVIRSMFTGNLGNIVNSRKSVKLEKISSSLSSSEGSYSSLSSSGPTVVGNSNGGGSRGSGSGRGSGGSLSFEVNNHKIESSESESSTESPYSEICDLTPDNENDNNEHHSKQSRHSVSPPAPFKNAETKTTRKNDNCLVLINELDEGDYVNLMPEDSVLISQTNNIANIKSEKINSSRTVISSNVKLNPDHYTQNDAEYALIMKPSLSCDKL